MKKSIKRINESQLRTVVSECVRRILAESSIGPLTQAIMRGCNVDEATAQEYLQSSVSEIHSLMDTGQNLKYSDFEEELSMLGVDADYVMDFAQYCTETYTPSAEKQNRSENFKQMEEFSRGLQFFEYNSPAPDDMPWFDCNNFDRAQIKEIQNEVWKIQEFVDNLGYGSKVETYRTMGGHLCANIWIKPQRNREEQDK